MQWLRSQSALPNGQRKHSDIPHSQLLVTSRMNAGALSEINQARNDGSSSDLYIHVRCDTVGAVRLSVTRSTKDLQLLTRQVNMVSATSRSNVLSGRAGHCEHIASPVQSSRSELDREKSEDERLKARWISIWGASDSDVHPRRRATPRRPDPRVTGAGKRTGGKRD